MDVFKRISRGSFATGYKYGLTSMQEAPHVLSDVIDRMIGQERWSVPRFNGRGWQGVSAANVALAVGVALDIERWVPSMPPRSPAK